MWKKLAGLNDELIVALQTHRDICDGTVADITKIAQLRWRIAQIGRHRLDHLNNTILPSVEATATGEFARRFQALRDATPQYRQQISRFVAEWPTEVVEQDWIAYRAQSLAIIALIQRRLVDEHALMQVAAAGHGDRVDDAREAVASLKAEAWR